MSVASNVKGFSSKQATEFGIEWERTRMMVRKGLERAGWPTIRFTCNLADATLDAETYPDTATEQNI